MKDLAKKKIIFTAGGTGGHIFPALAVAKLCLDEYDVLWVGGKQGIENKIVPEANIPYKSISMYGLRQNGLRRKLFMPFLLLRAFLQIIWILLSERPDVIVGFGGYVTFPVCCMGRLLAIPVVIHEQNSIPGLTNKILAKIATRVLVGFPNVLTSAKTIVVGNPVRADISNLLVPEIRYANRSGGLNIVVIGGSLGAKVFNDVLPMVFDTVNKLSPGHINKITHQVGRGDPVQIMVKYQELGLTDVNVVSFISDMATLYSEADLLICRAGASTVSEVCASGVAAIFVPYPHAVDDHQRYNAEPLVDKNAALMLLQDQFNGETVTEILLNITREKCLDMACIVRSLAITDSVKRIKQVITDLIV